MFAFSGLLDLTQPNKEEKEAKKREGVHLGAKVVKEGLWFAKNTFILKSNASV